MIVNRRSIQIYRLISDLILLNIAFLLAAVLAQSWQILLDKNHMFFLLIANNVIWIFSTNTTNFYDDFNSRYFAYQFINIIKNTIVQIITGVLFIFVAKENLFTRNFILFYALFLILFVSVRTILFKSILKGLRKKGKNIRNLLILGAGEVGQNFYNMINENPEFGYNFAGFIETGDEQEKSEKIIGSYNRLEEILNSKKIDEVVIAIPDSSSVLLDNIIKVCNKNAVKIHIIPDYFRFISKKFHVNMIGNFPIITARSEPLDELHWRFIKRTFDFIFSFLVLILICSWLFPLIIILIKIDSKGSALFKQERIGVKNRMFTCYKFRTMHTKEANLKNFTPTESSDPRITKVGHWLRKTNLDELPQLLNVFIGDMSIVGPRPHPVAFDAQYSKFFEEIKIRHNVKPGLTGWAQVHGLRGDVLDEVENSKRIVKRIKYDIWYVENWSLYLDIQIILLTVWQMIRGKVQGT